ncbi:hypothetical protein PVAP13_2KG531000 [Panicum virgatum]|uniref:Uncharacterized protein n=1 Tax=Panicum virgatum TaxID=38727 RepID=A0A8T0WFN2_PANVG|nr:hypothetical protein PVAP13_2KG531000 [Panicum virgatum]
MTLLDPCCLACIVPIRVGKDTSARSAQDCMVVFGLRIGEGGGTTHDISHRRSRSCVHGVWSRWNNISASAPAPLRATGVGVGRPVRRSVEVAQCSRDHSESDVNGFIKWMQPLCLAFSYVKCWNIRIFFLSSCDVSEVSFPLISFI